MRIQEAKAIPMRELLASLGHHPVKEDKGECWYRSPFREENKPSFKIAESGKAWFDFGLGKGGTIIDFGQLYWHTNISGVLRELSNMNFRPIPSPVTNLTMELPLPVKVSESEYQNFRVRKLQHPALRGYLLSRGISFLLAQRFVEEAHYTVNGRPYFSLAFQNQGGGYELRNALTKLCHTPKDITVLRAAGDGSPVRVYEGFMDFLSDLVPLDWLAFESLPFTAVVLNGAAMKEKALHAIRELNPSQVVLCLDNDNTGKALTRFFVDALAGLNVIDRSPEYSPSHDLNAWLMHQKGLNKGR